MTQASLGRSGVQVPPLGLGVMTWGVATGLQRLMPAKSAYGGATLTMSRTRSTRVSQRR